MCVCKCTIYIYYYIYFHLFISGFSYIYIYTTTTEAQRSTTYTYSEEDTLRGESHDNKFTTTIRSLVVHIIYWVEDQFFFLNNKLFVEFFSFLHKTADHIVAFATPYSDYKRCKDKTSLCHRTRDDFAWNRKLYKWLIFYCVIQTVLRRVYIIHACLYIHIKLQYIREYVCNWSV